jgi:hypothetical protein
MTLVLWAPEDKRQILWKMLLHVESTGSKKLMYACTEKPNF